MCDVTDPLVYAVYPQTGFPHPFVYSMESLEPTVPESLLHHSLPQSPFYILHVAATYHCPQRRALSPLEVELSFVTITTNGEH